MNEELKIIISAETEKLKKGVDEAKGALGTFKSEISKNKEELKKAWTSIGDGATKASKTIITSVGTIGGALIGTSALTADYREEQGKLATAFESAGSSANQAKETYNDLYRVLGDSGQATEAAGHLAKLTTNQQELSQWTTICEGVYATFGDSLPIEGLTEAANETAKTGELTGVLADALNWAGVSEDDFKARLEACNSESQREKLIRETLNGLYTDAAAKYEENNAQVLAQNEASAQLQDTMAKLGEAVAPVVDEFTKFAADALEKIAPYVQELAEKLLPKLQEVLQGVGEFLAPIVDFVVNHLPLIAGIAGIILGIAAAYQVITAALTIYNGIKTVYTTITTIATAAQTAFAAANMAALAPILLVIAAIAALIAVIVVCIKNWDKIKETVEKVWKAMKDGVKKAVDAVKEKFSEMKEKVVGKLNELKEKASEKFNQIKESAKEKFNAMKETMGNIMGAAKETISEKLNKIKGAYESHGGGFQGVVAATMEGIKGYYSAGFTFIDKLTGGKLSSVVNTVRDKMNAARDTISNVLNSIREKFQTIFDGAADIVRRGIDKIKSFFNFKWSLPKIKLPHFSITGKFSLKPPSVPHFSVSWYKLGGVFDSTTLFPFGGRIGGLGEDGAEAIVPLEKNTKWLDRLASMLAEKQGGSRPIVLQVDGRTFAEISVESINQLTRQRGSLPLKLV